MKQSFVVSVENLHQIKNRGMLIDIGINGRQKKYDKES
jgi:hypothetical protein